MKINELIHQFEDWSQRTKDYYINAEGLYNANKAFVQFVALYVIPKENIRIDQINAFATELKNQNKIDSPDTFETAYTEEKLSSMIQEIVIYGRIEEIGALYLSATQQLGAIFNGEDTDFKSFINRCLDEKIITAYESVIVLDYFDNIPQSNVEAFSAFREELGSERKVTDAKIQELVDEFAQWIPGLENYNKYMKGTGENGPKNALLGFLEQTPHRLSYGDACAFAREIKEQKKVNKSYHLSSEQPFSFAEFENICQKKWKRANQEEQNASLWRFGRNIGGTFLFIMALLAVYRQFYPMTTQLTCQKGERFDDGIKFQCTGEFRGTINSLKNCIEEIPACGVETETIQMDSWPFNSASFSFKEGCSPDAFFQCVKRLPIQLNKFDYALIEQKDNEDNEENKSCSMEL